MISILAALLYRNPGIKLKCRFVWPAALQQRRTLRPQRV